MRDSDEMTPTLRVEQLARRFGSLQAVDDVSFTIDRGETFGLLGPNGAGKTTTISMICGLLEPDAGQVTVCGERMRTSATRGRELVGYVPQELAIYPDMSARDNLRFFGRLYGLRGAEAARRIDEVLDIVALRDRADDRAKEFSGGMQRRLNIAAGMLHKPQLLILDEPTVGVDPQSRNAILDSIDALGDDGLSVLYTTHYMEEAERLCDRLAIMDAGRILAMGTRRELVNDTGEHDEVTFTVHGDSDAATRQLASLPGVHRAARTDARGISCVVDDASGMLPALMTAISDAGATVQNVHVQEPSLDTVFLQLTGTALRD